MMYELNFLGDPQWRRRTEFLLGRARKSANLVSANVVFAALTTMKDERAWQNVAFLTSLTSLCPVLSLLLHRRFVCVRAR